MDKIKDYMDCIIGLYSCIVGLCGLHYIGLCGLHYRTMWTTLYSYPDCSIKLYRLHCRTKWTTI